MNTTAPEPIDASMERIRRTLSQAMAVRLRDKIALFSHDLPDADKDRWLAEFRLLVEEAKELSRGR